MEQERRRLASRLLGKLCACEREHAMGWLGRALRTDFRFARALQPLRYVIGESHRHDPYVQRASEVVLKSPIRATNMCVRPMLLSNSQSAGYLSGLTRLSTSISSSRVPPFSLP